MAVVIKTIAQEVYDAMNFNTTVDSVYTSAVATAQTYLTDAVINRLAYANILGSETTYTVTLYGDNFDFDGGTPDVYQLYWCDKRRYEYWLSPSFTTQTNVSYILNASGSVEVTSTTVVSPASAADNRTSFTVSAVPVNFAMLMVDILRYLSNHHARDISQNMGAVSVSPATVRQELMRQASHWASENYLFMGG